MRNPCWNGIAVIASVVMASSAQAVIVYDDTAPYRNTTTAGLTASEVAAWDLQGSYRGFLGTPIGPRHFVVAKHTYTGSDPNQTISFGSGLNDTNGTAAPTVYTAGAIFDDPDSDLRVYELANSSPSFMSWASLYTGSNELTKALTVFGTGAAPGSVVTVDGELKGWQWGATGPKSWGRNIVNDLEGTPSDNPLLIFDFDAVDGIEEAGLAGGDSGGGVFIEEGGVLKLAGINYGVSGPYKFDDNGEPTADDSFNATLFDLGGLWVQTGTNSYTFVPDSAEDIPGISAATRISSRLSWIQSVVPEPASGLMLLALLGLGRRRR